MDGLSILLVEDSIDNRMIFQVFLKNSPHFLDMAENGQEAIEKIKRGYYDLVFMDMLMPVMDGFEATLQIRKWEKEAGKPRITIVALSANNENEDIEKSLKAGCSDYITKPLKKTVLLDLLTKHGKIKRAATNKKDEGNRVVLRVQADFKALVPRYFRHRENDFKNMQNALQKKDFEEVARLGHSMKGSGAAYGFEKISEIGSKLEKAANGKDGERTQNLLSELRAYLDALDLRYDESNS